MGMNFQLVFRVWKSDYRRKPQNQGPSSKIVKAEVEPQAQLPHPESFSNGECFGSSHLGVAISQNGYTLPLTPGESMTKSNGKILKHD